MNEQDRKHLKMVQEMMELSMAMVDRIRSQEERILGDLVEYEGESDKKERMQEFIDKLDEIYDATDDVCDLLIEVLR